MLDSNTTPRHIGIIMLLNYLLDPFILNLRLLPLLATCCDISENRFALAVKPSWKAYPLMEGFELVEELAVVLRTNRG